MLSDLTDKYVPTTGINSSLSGQVGKYPCCRQQILSRSPRRLSTSNIAEMGMNKSNSKNSSVPAASSKERGYLLEENFCVE